MRVEPHDRDPAVARGERLNRADVRATATAEDERPLGKVERERQALFGEGVLGDHRSLGVGKREGRCLGHGLAVTTPGARNPYEAGAERPSTGVALVLRPECDRGVRPALGALGA